MVQFETDANLGVATFIVQTTKAVLKLTLSHYVLLENMENMLIEKKTLEERDYQQYLDILCLFFINENYKETLKKFLARLLREDQYEKFITFKIMINPGGRVEKYTESIMSIFEKDPSEFIHIGKTLLLSIASKISKSDNLNDIFTFISTIVFVKSSLLDIPVDPHTLLNMVQALIHHVEFLNVLNGRGHQEEEKESPSEDESASPQTNLIKNTKKEEKAARKLKRKLQGLRVLFNQNLLAGFLLVFHFRFDKKSLLDEEGLNYPTIAHVLRNFNKVSPKPSFLLKSLLFLAELALSEGAKSIEEEGHDDIPENEVKIAKEACAGLLSGEEMKSFPFIQVFGSAAIGREGFKRVEPIILSVFSKLEQVSEKEEGNEGSTEFKNIVLDLLMLVDCENKSEFKPSHSNLPGLFSLLKKWA